MNIYLYLFIKIGNAFGKLCYNNLFYFYMLVPIFYTSYN